MANLHRPARTTPNLGIPVSGDDDLADYVSAWGATADATDAAVKGAVDAANASFATQVSAAQSAALPYALMLAGC